MDMSNATGAELLVTVPCRDNGSYVTVTVNDTGDGDDDQTWGEDIYLLTLLCPISLMCLAGNGLVIVTMVTNSSLRNPQHYFIFSLAASDFMNGLFFPIYVTSHTKFKGVQETLGMLYCAQTTVEMRLHTLIFSAIY